MNGDIYIVVPSYNEEIAIEATIEDLLKVFNNIIVVNDGSSDCTLSVLQELDVILINHLINIGQGAALQTGITYALKKGARIIVTFDADGQHRSSDAINMIEELEKDNCDVVLGSRFLGTAVNIPSDRKLLLKIAIAFSNFTTGVRLSDAHNGLRVMSRNAAACLAITQHGMAHASELVQQLHKSGMRIKEHPVTIHYTKYSISKGQRSSNAISVLLDLIFGRFFR